MAKSKIFKDSIGLYTNCGGYISRPFFGTKFKEGDDVNTRHFGGSTNAGVTSPNKPETHNFKKSGQYETWTTTGINNYDYKKKNFKLDYESLFGASYSTFEEYMKLQTKWYENGSKIFSSVYSAQNLKFTI